MNLKKEFGQRLKELRCKSGITQYQLAEIVHVDPKHISQIETGRSFPKADLIEKLANALNVNYTSFFKTEYMQNRKILTNKINTIIKNSTDENLKIIYKLLLAYTD